MANWNDLFTADAGGGAGLIFPQRTLNLAAVTIKTASATREFMNVAAAYTAIEQDFSRTGFVNSTYLPTPDTTEQTILDVTGEAGVLTHIISPQVTVIGDMTIRITIDGNPAKVFTDTLQVANSDVLTMGDFQTFEASTSGVTAITQLGDIGYNTGQQASMTTAPQAIERKIGLPYTTSIKVTIQGSSSVVVGSATNKAVACRMLNIPEGL